jgi:hypothetical protein
MACSVLCHSDPVPGALFAGYFLLPSQSFSGRLYHAGGFFLKIAFGCDQKHDIKPLMVFNTQLEVFSIMPVMDKFRKNWFQSVAR